MRRGAQRYLNLMKLGFLADLLLSTTTAVAASNLPQRSDMVPLPPVPYVSKYCAGPTVEIWVNPTLGTIQFLEPGYDVIWTRDGNQKIMITGGGGTGISTRIAAGIKDDVPSFYDWTEANGLPVLLWNGEPFELRCMVLDES